MTQKSISITQGFSFDFDFDFQFDIVIEFDIEFDLEFDLEFDFCMELAQLLSRRRWEKCAFCRGAAGKSAHVVEMLLLDTFRRFTSKNTTFWPNFAASARQKCYDPVCCRGAAGKSAHFVEAPLGKVRTLSRCCCSTHFADLLARTRHFGQISQRRLDKSVMTQKSISITRGFSFDFDFDFQFDIDIDIEFDLEFELLIR